MNSLTKNTIYLYGLTAANYLFSLLTIPFITRILGPKVYGDLGFSMAIGVYFNLIIDFGFLLSATKRVAQNPNNIDELKRILTAVTSVKLTLSIGLFILLSICALFVPVIAHNYILLSLFLLLGIITSALPDYMYRGLEDMKMITVRGVVTRGIFTVLIIVFLRKPSQVLFIPIFNIVGAILAFIWVYVDLVKRYHITFCKIKYKDIKQLALESAPYFLSRIAAAIYNVSNTVILGLLYPGQAVVGYYTSSEKIWSVSGQACSPLADSLYPYMIRTGDYKKLFRLLTLLEIPIVLGCICGIIWAKEVCIIIFGEAFAPAAEILVWFMPIIGMILPTYMCGFPALAPIHKEKWANRSVEFAMVNQVIGLICLFFLKDLTAVNLCRLTLCSQVIVLFVRVGCLVGNRKVISDLMASPVKSAN